MSTAQTLSTGKIALVTVRVGESWLGFEAHLVERIADTTPSIPLPQAPAHVAGLVLIGSRAVPELDLGRFLGIPPEEEVDRDVPPRLVLCSAGSLNVALRCRHVSIDGEIDRAELAAPRFAHTDALRRFALHEVELGDRLVIVIDMPALLEAARVRR